MNNIIPDTSRNLMDINSEMLWYAFQELDNDEKKQVWQLIKTLQNNRSTANLPERNPHVLAHQAQMPQQGKGRRIYTLGELKSIADSYQSDFEWSYDRLKETFPTEPRVKVELIDGQLHIYPNVLATEPEIIGNIGFLMLQASDKKRKDNLLFTPIDLVLDERNIFQPAICFISTNQTTNADNSAAFGVPELVLEIVSSIEAVEEREMKRDLYESFGVKEYWEVRPDKKRIEVEILHEGIFVPHCKARRKGKVSSTVLKGFTLAVEDIFERD